MGNRSFSPGRWHSHPQERPYSRREFLALTVAGGIATALPDLSAWAAEPLRSRAIPVSVNRCR